MSAAQILDGIRVVEFCQVLAGPYSCQILADMGAEVVKVEQPVTGDHSRKGWGTIASAGNSAPFIAVNRNKKSLTLDVATAAGRDVFFRLISAADVLVENFRPGVMKRLGIDYATLSKVNPKLVYASISGFGQTGPYAARPGYDIIAQAMSGVMSVTGEEDGPPAKCGVPIADIGAALFATIGIVSALLQRDRNGVGCHLDTSLYEAAMAMSVWEASEYWSSGNIPGPLGSRHRLNAPYQVLKTKDGYVAIGANTEQFWSSLCHAIDRPDLLTDPRFTANRERVRRSEELAQELERTFAAETVDVWVDRLLDAGVPVGPVRNYAESLSDAHTIARNMVLQMRGSDGVELRSLNFPVKFDDDCATVRRLPPSLGEHTAEVLGWLGYTAVQIDAMRTEGVV